MRETKLIIVLRALDTIEIKAFDKFVHSPYFNTSDTIIKLWSHLKKYAPDFESALLEKEKTYKKIFPEEVFNDKKLRQLRSRLFKLVEEFLAVERFKKDNFRLRKEVADTYLEKGIKDYFEKKYGELQQSFDTIAFLSTSELHQKMTLHHHAYFNELNVKGDDCSTDLITSTLLLEKYYTQQKLIYTLEWLSSNLRYNYTIPQSILDYVEVIKHIPIINDIDSTQSILINAVKLLLAEDNWKNLFKKLNSQFSKLYPRLDKKLKNLMLRFLINYCIHKENKELSLTAEIIQLHKLGLTDGGIFYKGLMTNATFLNIVINALKVGENKWINAFIEQESYRLYEPQNEQYVFLAKAATLFYEKKYPDCLEILAKMQRNDLVILELIKRNLQIRTIFECYRAGQIHVKMLYADIKKQDKYLQRKHILSNNKRKAYQNFGKYILRLINWCENNGNQKQLIKLKKELIKEELFPNKSRDWLLTHIHSFEKKHGVACATPSKNILSN